MWLDVLARPMNRLLVAQRITFPQMAASFAAVPLHFVTIYVFIKVRAFGLVPAGARQLLLSDVSECYALVSLKFCRFPPNARA